MNLISPYYTDQKFLGVAIIELTSNCKQTADDYLAELAKNNQLMVFPDGHVEPLPVVSGSTGRR